MDISLDNLVLDAKDRVVLVDPGLSLRVPHSDPCNPDCVSDVSAGTSRRLMIAQGQGGKLNYAAPEVVEKVPAVDAYAVDLWAAGVVLFVMLVGLAPFKWAHSSDKRFAQISRGGLGDLIAALDIPLSPEAIDLLQGFFYRDPRQRWNLAEVMEHPWVQGKQFKNVGYADGHFSFPIQGGTKRLPMNKNFDGLSSKCQPNTRLAVPQNAYYC
jgi:serine/threonine protein kinase